MRDGTLSIGDLVVGNREKSCKLTVISGSGR